MLEKIVCTWLFGFVSISIYIVPTDIYMYFTKTLEEPFVKKLRRSHPSNRIQKVFIYISYLSICSGNQFMNQSKGKINNYYIETIENVET